MPDRKKLSPSELLDALHDMTDEDALLDEADRVAKLSDGEVAAEVKALGGDPDAIGARGAAFAEALARGEPPWKAKAKARLAAAHRAMESAPKTPASLPRKELLARIDAARKNPRFSAPVSAFFRKRKPEETSDDELREMLDELLALEAIEKSGEGGGHDGGAS